MNIWLEYLILFCIILTIFLAGVISASAEVVFKTGSYVKHLDDRQWHEGFNNRGVGMEVDILETKHENGSVTYSLNLMTFENSYNRRAYSVAPTVRRWYYTSNQSARFGYGLSLQFLHGYKPQSGLNITPMPVPVLTADLLNREFLGLQVPLIGVDLGVVAPLPDIPATLMFGLRAQPWKGCLEDVIFFWRKSACPAK